MAYFKRSGSVVNLLGRYFFHFVLLVLLATASEKGYSQTPSGGISGEAGQANNRIQIVNADRLIKTKDSQAQKFIGNVQLSHQEVKLFCDSAYLFLDSNRLHAYSRVRIIQGDSLSLKGDTLYYIGNNKLARMRGNVIMNDRDLRLTTSSLKYNLADSVGSYSNGAKITSSRNSNVLTSKVGLYFSNARVLEFRDSVVLTNPQYVMNSDTLTYNTLSEQAYFSGPTTIVSDSNLIYTENGWYDTRNDLASLTDSSYILADGQKLEGDSLFYNRGSGVGEVFRNIRITDTTNNFIIYGHYGWHNEKTNRSLITDSLLLVQTFEEDSLYLHADSAIIEEDSLENQKIHAFHHVKFFKKDMQGASDSLVFNQLDSTISMYYDPILWSDQNQLYADFIKVKTESGAIRSMLLDQNAFLISEADTNGYNQIKGTTMTALFDSNRLETLHVVGNAQSVYFVGEEGKKPIGMNHAVCSEMTINIQENKVEQITFREQPDAVLYPMHRINPKVRQLQGFKWEYDRRPNKVTDIFIQ